MMTNEKPPIKISVCVRKCRNERNMTQDTLAEKSGVSVETIKRIERGKETRSDTLWKLNKAFGENFLAEAYFGEIKNTNDDARIRKIKLTIDKAKYLIDMLNIQLEALQKLMEDE